MMMVRKRITRTPPPPPTPTPPTIITIKSNLGRLRRGRTRVKKVKSWGRRGGEQSNKATVLMNHAPIFFC